MRNGIIIEEPINNTLIQNNGYMGILLGSCQFLFFFKFAVTTLAKAFQLSMLRSLLLNGSSKCLKKMFEILLDFVLILLAFFIFLDFLIMKYFWDCMDSFPNLTDFQKRLPSRRSDLLG